MDYEKLVLTLLQKVNELEAKVTSFETELKSLGSDSKKIKDFTFKDEMKIEKNCLSFNRSLSQVEKISNYISDAITEAITKGLDHIFITSGDVHRILGLKNRIPSVCSAMRKVAEEDKRIKFYNVTRDTPSHNSSTYTIRYDF